MDLGLTGRTAIVCGASSGIGLAIAEALAHEGANVAMFARRRDLLEREAERLGALAVRGDVAVPADLERLVERTVAEADLVIGAVLVPGGRAPVVVSEDMVRAMKPGAVIIDIAIDQGGCVETSHETTHSDPVFEKHGVLHYAVGNMPGAVPHTSTHALTNATLPYLAELAQYGVAAACARDLALAHGVNTMGGHVTNEAVAESIAEPYVPLDTVLG